MTPPTPSPPANYVHGHDRSVLAVHNERTAANSCGYLLPYLKPGMSLLDVGCGPGSVTIDLARTLGAESRVVGIDRVEGPLEGAREAGVAAGVDAEFRVGDVYALAESDERFDVVHAHQVLQHLSDPVGALRSMRAACRPGGIVAVRDADYGAMVFHPAEPRIERWRELHRVTARRAGGEPDAGRRLRAWAVDAGFTDVRVTSSVWTYADRESLAARAESWAQRIEHSAFREQALAAGLADEAELADLAAAWRSWGDEPGALYLVPHVEVIAFA